MILQNIQAAAIMRGCFVDMGAGGCGMGAIAG